MKFIKKNDNYDYKYPQHNWETLVYLDHNSNELTRDKRNILIYDAQVYNYLNNRLENRKIGIFRKFIHSSSKYHGINYLVWDYNNWYPEALVAYVETEPLLFNSLKFSGNEKDIL